MIKKNKLTSDSNSKTDFKAIKPLPSFIGRRDFLAAAAAATAGAIWIKPLHVEAKDNWWERLFTLATNFAKGILFSNLGGGIPGFLQNLLPVGMELMQNGLFGFKQNIVAPSDSPTATALQKMLAYIYNTKLLKGAMPYIKKLLDATGKFLPKDFPINNVTGQLIAALGKDITTTDKTPFNLMQMYLGKYRNESDDFKTGLMLPTEKGGLPYPNGISLGQAAIATAQNLLKNPPALYENYDLVHLTESGTITLQRSVAQNLKKEGNDIDRGEAKLQLFIIPAKSTDQSLREAHKNVVNWLAKPANANYWTNAAKKTEFFNVVKTNSVLPNINATFEFAREL